MNVTTIEPTPDLLAQYGAIPMRLEVRSILEVTLVEGGMGGLTMQERPVTSPWLKDYDADGDRPRDWARIFDVSSWGFFLARSEEGSLLGGATVAFRTEGVHMLEGRSDMGVLWDIRVDPKARGRGVGTALFEHAMDWLRERGAVRLKVETQNINVPACRFYHKRGCTLGAISRFAYHEPELAHEVQLLWYREL